MRLAIAPILLAAMTVVAPPVHAHGTPESFAELAEKALPAVVNISTQQTVEQRRVPEMPQFPPGSPFEEFFKRFFDQAPGDRQDRPPRRATSLGSGFIIDPAGIIVTNNHVIDEADEITVRLQDDRQLEAEVVGRDPKTDLAVLRVETEEPLPFLEFGDSDKTRVGDWVIAIGNPFGFSSTVTAGIVSARKRDIRAGPYDDFIQTDAAINKGNSGGPMLNLEGKVIGVNTAITSPSGGSVGIGFAVPASLAAPVIDQLRRFRETRRGWLGVRIQNVTDEIAAAFEGFGEPRGALVAAVMPDSPAEKGGLQTGDIVLSFDGKQVAKMRALPRIVSDAEVGAMVPVEVWRKGKVERLEVVVGRLEEIEQAGASPEGETKEHPIEELGLVVAAPNDELRKEYELDEEVLERGGLVIVGVAPGSDAEEKGLEAGDLIIEADQAAVGRPKELETRIAAVRDAGRRSVLLLVNRDGDDRFVAVMLEAGAE
ncbi:MAG: DegQ family serine endoprotease [Alphaproteobacteria bacterium]|nr:DegQ family serine endoprotease [Alphaproteobacteria bacterium]